MSASEIPFSRPTLRSSSLAASISAVLETSAFAISSRAAFLRSAVAAQSSRAAAFARIPNSSITLMLPSVAYTPLTILH